MQVLYVCGVSDEAKSRGPHPLQGSPAKKGNSRRPIGALIAGGRDALGRVRQLKSRTVRALTSAKPTQATAGGLSRRDMDVAPKECSFWLLVGTYCILQPLNRRHKFCRLVWRGGTVH